MTKSGISPNSFNSFPDLSIAKQILVVIGLSIVIAALGFLTAQLLQLSKIHQFSQK